MNAGYIRIFARRIRGPRRDRAAPAHDRAAPGARRQSRVGEREPGSGSGLGHHRIGAEQHGRQVSRPRQHYGQRHERGGSKARQRGGEARRRCLAAPFERGRKPSARHAGDRGRRGAPHRPQQPTLKPVNGQQPSVSGPRHAITQGGLFMNEDRVIGAARNIGGHAQEGFGRATGDPKSQAEGVVNQAAGAAQNLYGQAKDGAADAAQAVREGASSAEDVIRHVIEQRPYTAALVALCIGWFIGRTGRRD